MASTTNTPRPAVYVNQGKLNRDMTVRSIGKIALWITPIFSFFFLWAPIVVLVVFSFNKSRSVATFTGVTLDWYANIFSGALGAESAFSTELLLDSLRNSLIIGVISTIFSTIIGTMVAMSLVRSDFPGKKVLDSVLYLPVVIPEITQGISLAVFFNILFNYWNTLTGQRLYPGMHTVIIGHVAFTISFVAVVVRARLADMNPKLEEAARDLGANEWRTFWEVTFPLLLPGIISGGLLAFTLSLDDFLVTFFTAGTGTNTLPVFVFGLLKLTITPEINAISTIMVMASTLLIGISLSLQGRNAVAG